MPRFSLDVACDPSAYGEIEVEADTWQQAVEKVDRDAIECAVYDVEYAMARSHRILNVTELDENGNGGNPVAYDIDLSPEWEAEQSRALQNLTQLTTAADVMLRAFGQLRDEGEEIPEALDEAEDALIAALAAVRGEVQEPLPEGSMT